MRQALVANLNYFISISLMTALSLVTSEDIKLEGTFAEQVELIVKHQTLGKEDYAAYQRAVADVYQALDSRWPGTKLLPFGSMLTGLVTPLSDVDFYVIVPSAANERTITDILLQAESILKQHVLFTNVQEYSEEAVKVIHTLTNREVHLFFTKPSLKNNTKLVKYLVNSDRKIWKLVVLIKYWSQVQNFYKKLHSYIFIMLAIFYLQRMHILPAVYELQQNVEPVFFNNWNTAFDDTVRNFSCPIEFFDLLVGFFEYYANFDFERLVISPYVGYPINRARFENPKNLPGEFALYRMNVANNVTAPIDLRGTVCIQDPFNHSENIVRRLDPTLVDTLKGTFRKVYNMYRVDGNSDDFLIEELKTTSKSELN